MKNINLDSLIIELDMRVRTYNKLRQAGITTIGQLIKFTRAEIIDKCNMAYLTISDLEEALALAGFSLKNTEPEEKIQILIDRGFICREDLINFLRKTSKTTQSHDN